MKPKKNVSERVPVGTFTLQSGDGEPKVFDSYLSAPDLPENVKKREVCYEHVRAGAASDLMHDFILGGVRFPDESEPQEITTQLSCKGVGCILKKCGLTITQYDSNGKEIGKMKVAE